MLTFGRRICILWSPNEAPVADRQHYFAPHRNVPEIIRAGAHRVLSSTGLWHSMTPVVLINNQTTGSPLDCEPSYCNNNTCRLINGIKTCFCQTGRDAYCELSLRATTTTTTALPIVVENCKPGVQSCNLSSCLVINGIQKYYCVPGTTGPNCVPITTTTVFEFLFKNFRNKNVHQKNYILYLFHA